VLRGREHQADARVLPHVVDLAHLAARLGRASAPPSSARRRLRPTLVVGAAGVCPPLAPHHHVVVQVEPARERDHDVLAVRPHVLDAPADDAHRELVARRAGALAQLDRLDGAADQHLGDAVRGATDFGAFRHVPL
jgi:hypothetical protein